MLCSQTESFPEMGISHGPPAPPDLTPCDYFLWGCLKTKVFVTKPRTIADLKQRIQDEVAGDAARGHEQMQVPTSGMRASKRKLS